MQPSKRSVPASAIIAIASERLKSTIQFYAQALGNGSHSTEPNTIQLASRDFAQQIGVSSQQWLFACDQVGADIAVLCLALVDRNCDAEGSCQVRNPAAAFTGLVRREAQGEAAVAALSARILRQLSDVPTGQLSRRSAWDAIAVSSLKKNKGKE